MNLDDVSKRYGILKGAIERIKESDKIEDLFPPQEEALNSGYLDGGNLVLALSTSSGKTLLAELSILKTILEKGKKAIYLVPLKALAMEKYREFKEKYEPLGIRVAVSIGDYDKSDNWLSKFDIVITSNEKCDSLLRHESSFFNDVGIIIADEVHLLDDVSRGPTLEIVLSRLRNMNDAKIMALSATIQNAIEIAEWLNAKLVESDFRPTRLYEGIYFGNKVSFPKDPDMDFSINNDIENSLSVSKHMHKNGKQTLIFVSTRRSAEAEAEKTANIIRDSLKWEDATRLRELADRIENALGHPTKQCRKLADMARKGVAFHHAGLAQKQRTMIEDAFRSGLLKVISATTTLAFGLNLPGDVCIIRDTKRYYQVRGYDFIPISEYKQCVGRAGRVKYSKTGTSIIIAKNENEKKTFAKRFILGEPEKITSKLGVEPVLRMHVLSLIASGVTPNKESLFDFFSKTFYAHQYKDLGLLNRNLEKVLDMLENFGFITTGKKESSDGNPFRSASSMLEEEGTELRPTRIGKRVSELYIDPLTANHLIKSLGIINSKGTSDFGLLHVISNCLEMKPLLSLRKKDFEYINELLTREGDSLPLKPPREWDLEYDDYLKSLKTANMFKNWIEESGEDRILEELNVAPGELRARLERADWLLYSAQELGLLLNCMNILKDIRKVRLRVKYGIREELLPLVRLKGVGRVIARKLWNSNLRSLQDLRKVPMESLSRIVGLKRAEMIKGQLD